MPQEVDHKHKVTLFDNYILCVDTGTVFSIKKNRYLKLSDSNKLLIATFCVNGKTKSYSIARIIYEKFIGIVKKNEIVSYKDGDHKNVSVTNLFCRCVGGGKRRFFTDQEKSQIIRLYSDKWTIHRLSKKFITNQRSISAILKDNKIRIRTGRDSDTTTYSLNHSYFKVIDSEKKAYLLGFSYADGNVSVDSNSISIGINDKPLLEEFMILLDIRNKELYCNPSHKGKHYTLVFSSREMKNDLIKLGCFPQKSLTLKFPIDDQVPARFLSHFIRGYFDGDGCICITRKNCPQAGFVGSTLFLSEMKYYLEELGIKCCKLQSRPPHKPETSVLRITGINNVRVFKDFMYNNSTISLDRKRIKFETV